MAGSLGQGHPVDRFPAFRGFPESTMSRLPVHVSSSRQLAMRLAGVCALAFGAAGCALLFSHHEVTFDKQGVEIGVETDISTRRVSPPVPNSHPARVTEAEIRTLLGAIEISGYSGTVVGVLINPPKRPLFSEEELSLIAAPIAQAFLQAGEYERVFFSIPDPERSYNPDRIAGALFLRGPYLHLVVTDHYAYLRADTGGGDDYKDLLDVKGMKLWAMSPAKPATVRPDQVPAWHPFEKVHISLNVRDVLAARSGAPSLQATEATVPAKSDRQSPPPIPPPAPRSTEDLKSQLSEQRQAVESLRQEVERLRKELSPPKQPPQTGQPPSPRP